MLFNLVELEASPIKLIISELKKGTQSVATLTAIPNRRYMGSDITANMDATPTVVVDDMCL